MLEYSLIGNHGNVLRLRSQKAEVIASNLANSNTPEYKAIDFSIKDSIKTRSGKIEATNSGHFGSIDGRGISVNMQYRTPAQISLDGNTVETDQEIIRMSENSIRYQYSLKYMAGKMQMIKDILKDI